MDCLKRKFVHFKILGEIKIQRGQNRSDNRVAVVCRITVVFHIEIRINIFFKRHFNCVFSFDFSTTLIFSFKYKLFQHNKIWVKSFAIIHLSEAVKSIYFYSPEIAQKCRINALLHLKYFWFPYIGDTLSRNKFDARSMSL